MLCIDWRDRIIRLVCYDLHDGMPELLREKNLSDLEIRLLLVVKNAEKAWLMPFQDVLETNFRMN